jgi:hypothetical protein
VTEAEETVALTRRASLGGVMVAVLLTALLGLALTTAHADAQSGTTVYGDAIGDAGEAPDVARVTIRPVADGLAIDIMLARPTRLGPYGWILFGLDTDRNPYTGGGRGDELLLFVNGEGATFTCWTGGGFSPDFVHHDLESALSGTDLTFVLSWADIGGRTFNFSVATLREDADLAPGLGIATYPRARTARPAVHPRRRHGIARRSFSARPPAETRQTSPYSRAYSAGLGERPPNRDRAWPRLAAPLPSRCCGFPAGRSAV